MNAVHPKVSAGAIGSGLGGALGIVIGWLLGRCGVVCPPDVSAAFGVILASLFSFLAGYFTPDKTVPPTSPTVKEKS